MAAGRVKVKKKRGLKASSRQWLSRQLNDPYVRAAKVKGYRSRAAFKLLELNEKFHFLKFGMLWQHLFHARLLLCNLVRKTH